MKPQFKVIPGAKNEGLSPELAGAQVAREAQLVLADLEAAMRLLGPMPPELLSPEERSELEAAS